MFTSNLDRVLLRKELRQLAPLVVAVLLLAFAIYGLFELRSDSMRAGTLSAGYILVAIPGLFAVGAGAMSVSQEKETRTLSWLASLPLSKERLILTKFVAALSYLMGLWLIVVLSCVAIDSLGFGPTFSTGASITLDNHPIYTKWIAYWMLNTFYLLVCGYLTAWRFGSSMTALVAFVPLAIAPPLLRFAFAYANDPGYAFGSPRYDATLGENLFAVTACLVPALWLMNRFACVALSPQQTRLPQNPYAATDMALDTSKHSSQSVLGQSSAMLWQFFRQNQIVFLSLCGISVIVGLPMLLFADTLNHSQRFAWEPLAIFCIFVITAWMGVLVFQGDNVQDRIRYLAELGVQPAKAWIMRLLLPLSYCGLVVLFYALILSRYQTRFPEQPQLPLWLIFWGLLVAFGYSQWFAQLARNPILSAIGGPMIAGLGFGYCIYAAVELTSAYRYAILLTIAPFVATFLMMRRWMDRRFQWQYWCSHLAILLLVVAAPLADLAWRVWRSPRMPDDVKVALREEAESIAAKPWSAYAISLAYLSQADMHGFGELPLEQRIERASTEPDTAEQVQTLEELLKASRHNGIQLGYGNDLGILVGRVVMARTRLEQADAGSAAREEYRLQVKLLAMIAQGLRRSANLKDQETADLAEIAMIAELQLPDAKERLGTEAWTNHVALVSDLSARNRARRRAVIASWAEFDAHDSDDKSNWSLGGFYTPNGRKYGSSTRHLLIRNRLLDHMTWTLLRYLEAGPTASKAEKIAFLRQRVLIAPERAEATVTAWVDDPATFTFPLNVSSLPGEQWFAGWEQVGATLAAKSASD